MKIISGGQTGVDRAALDFAIEHRIEYGGWIPKGRRAEDGPVSKAYSNLVETKSSIFQERTRRNVEDSDGTLIISHGTLTGGSLLTYNIARKLRKQVVHIDLETHSIEAAAEILSQWISENAIETLNVAGPRASGDAQIYDKTLSLLKIVLV